jgi:hypothetical protein
LCTGPAKNRVQCQAVVMWVSKLLTLPRENILINKKCIVLKIIKIKFIQNWW